MATVLAGLTVLQQTRTALLEDVKTAATRKGQADTLKAATDALRGQVQLWTPTGVTATDLVAIRNTLDQVLAQQQQILTALADLSVHRGQIDAAAAVGVEAAVFLARYLFGAE